MDLSFLIGYSRELISNRIPRNTSPKTNQVHNGVNALRLAVDVNDFDTYRKMVGCVAALSPNIYKIYPKFKWIDNRTYSIPRTGSWTNESEGLYMPATKPHTPGKDYNNPPSSNDAANQPSTPPNVIINQTHNCYRHHNHQHHHYNHSHTHRQHQHRYNTTVMDGPQLESRFKEIVFAETDIAIPTQILGQPEILVESTNRAHAKNISLRLTTEQSDKLIVRAQREDSEAIQYGVYLWMCKYKDACNYFMHMPKRPVSVSMPSSIGLNVNRTPLSMPNSRHRPIDITEYLGKSNGYLNPIQISYMTGERFIAILALCQRHTPQSIVKEVRKSKFVTPETVKHTFFSSKSDDDDLVSTGALVSLKCPLGLSRIRVPSRSMYCQHSQCFDGLTFLQLSMKQSVWKCPVCSNVIKSWKELIVDGYFESILNGTSENDEQVYIEPDGQWRHKDDAMPARHDMTPGSAKRPLQVDSLGPEVDLSDYDSSDLAEQSKTALAGNKRRRKTANTDLIDLTLDSDDNEDPTSSSSSSDNNSDSSGGGSGSDGNDSSNSLPRMTQEDIEFIESMENANNSTTTRPHTPTPVVAPPPNRTTVATSATIYAPIQPRSLPNGSSAATNTVSTSSAAAANQQQNVQSFFVSSTPPGSNNQLTSPSRRGRGGSSASRRNLPLRPPATLPRNNTISSGFDSAAMRLSQSTASPNRRGRGRPSTPRRSGHTRLSTGNRRSMPAAGTRAIRTVDTTIGSPPQLPRQSMRRSMPWNGNGGDSSSGNSSPSRWRESFGRYR